MKPQEQESKAEQAEPLLEESKAETPRTADSKRHFNLLNVLGILLITLGAISIYSGLQDAGIVQWNTEWLSRLCGGQKGAFAPWSSSHAGDQYLLGVGKADITG